MKCSFFTFRAPLFGTASLYLTGEATLGLDSYSMNIPRFPPLRGRVETQESFSRMCKDFIALGFHQFWQEFETERDQPEYGLETKVSITILLGTRARPA